MALPVKTELFDVDVLQKLVIKDGITAKDKADLQRYRRRRINGNQVMIQYDYGKDWKKVKLGRLYPSPAVGLTIFPKDIRAALAQKYYWDIDIENAQPTMLLTTATKYKVECPALLQYCENRETILQEIQVNHTLNRDEAKTLCISVLFGGYRDQHPILPTIYSELKDLSQKIALEFPKVIKIAKDNDAVNPYATCLSVYIQNEERLVLQAIDEFFTQKERHLDVLIFDGGLLRKLDTETTPPLTLLQDAEAFVLEKTGYSIHLTNKPMTHTFDFGTKELIYPTTTVIDDLFACKKFVELNPETFVRDGNETFMVNPATGLWGLVTFTDVKKILSGCFSDMNFKQESANGIRSFNYGGNLKNIKAMVEFLDVCAPEGKVPIEFAGSLGLQESNQEIVDLYLELLSLLSNHNEDKKQYLVQYMAHTIQKPRDLPGVCIIATGKQGCGKDTVFDIFMKYVLGSFYTTNLSNDVFFSQYDDLKARKVMVKLEEASAEYCSKHSDLLKTLITGRQVSFNPKHKSPFTTENFTRYIFTTNSGNPISIEGSDRRYVFYDCTNEKVGDSAFWTRVNTLLQTEEAGQVLYKWFLSIDISTFTPRVFPISEYQEAVREEYKSIEDKFYDDWNGDEASCSDIHKQFVLFCKRLRIAEDKIPNTVHFGRKMTTFLRDKRVTKRVKDGISYYRKPMELED
jgi:hypothetical protein